MADVYAILKQLSRKAVLKGMSLDSEPHEAELRDADFAPGKGERSARRGSPVSGQGSSEIALYAFYFILFTGTIINVAVAYFIELYRFGDISRLMFAVFLAIFAIAAISVWFYWKMTAMYETSLMRMHKHVRIHATEVNLIETVFIPSVLLIGATIAMSLGELNIAVILAFPFFFLFYGTLRKLAYWWTKREYLEELAMAPPPSNGADRKRRMYRTAFSFAAINGGIVLVCHLSIGRHELIEHSLYAYTFISTAFAIVMCSSIYVLKRFVSENTESLTAEQVNHGLD